MAGEGPSGRRYRLLAAAMAAGSAVVLLFVASHVLSPWPDALYGTDFVAFWTGGSLVREGAGPDLFDRERQHAFQVAERLEHGTAERIRLAPGSIPYINPPPLALPFAPLTLLPMPWAYLLWSALSLAALVAAVALPLRGAAQGRVGAVALLAFPAVGDTLLLGRVDGALLLAFSLALLAMASGRPVLGGALLGLLWLKPQYAVVFTLVLLVQRRRRELAGMAGVVLAGVIASLAMVGPAGLARYLELLREIGAFYPPSSAVVNPLIMVNWRALLMNAAPGIPEATGSVLMAALGGMTALASLLAWRGSWEPASPLFARRMLVAALATVLAAPHSHLHGTVLLLAPLARIGDRGPGIGKRGLGGQVWAPMVVAGYLLALASWVLLDLRWLLVPYFLLGMALLIYQIREMGPRHGMGTPALRES